MALTMPSPTRAMIVSSVAPPTKRSRFVRTVTRALAFTPMPSLATPSIVVLAAAGVRTVDDLGIDARAHRLEHGFAGALGGEVDGAGAVEIQRDARLVRGDQREDHLVDIAAGEVMRFERVGRHEQPGFHRRDAAIDDQPGRHAAQAHKDEREKAHRRVSRHGPDVDADEIEDQQRGDEDDDHEDAEDERRKHIREREGKVSHAASVGDPPDRENNSGSPLCRDTCVPAGRLVCSAALHP